MSKLADEFGLGAGAEAGQRKRSSLAEEFGLGGVKPSKPGIVRSAADTATALAGGAVTGAQQLANVAGADNPIAQTLGDGAKAVRDFESPARRAEREQRAAKIQQAEDSGSIWEEVKANVGAFAEAPIDTTVEAVGTSLPTIAAAALTRGRAPAITGGAVGALQGAGAVKGSIYDAVEQEYLKAGVSPEEAAARAAEAQAYSGENLAQIGVGAGLGGVAGSTGVESAVARLMSREAGAAAAQGVLRSALTGAAKEAPLEAVQGGQERLASNLALQGEGFNTPTWQGVAGSAALEGVAGAAAGGGFGAVEGVAGRSDQQLTSMVELGDEPSVAGDSSASAPLEESVNEPAAPPVVDDAAGAVQAPADRAVPPAVLEQFRLERPFPASRAEAVPLSQQMGLDPSAGPMSSAAALAVDSGATAQLQQQAVLQEAAKAAEKGGTASEQVNQETGEITQAQGDLLAADPATELQTRLEYVRQQARAGGWDARLVAERDRLVAELDQLLPQQAAADAAPQAVEQPAAPADLQAGIEQAQANAAAVEAAAGDAPADIRAVVAKQIPQMTDAELQQAIDHYGPDNKRTTKLQKELAKRRTQPHEEANAGEAPAEAQTEEQPAQVAPAPEAAPAEAASAVDAGARWAGMSQAERQALAEQTDIRPVIRRNLPRAQWESMNPDVQRRLAERMQQAPGKPAAEQGAPSIEGRDLGDGWAEFSQESGTAGIPRAEMPQIKAEHRGAMVNFMNARGVAHQEETVPAASLKPAQAEFSREKVAKAASFEGGSRSILVSSDGHVLDGHHQWLAAREAGDDVKVIRLDAPIWKLVDLAREFPSSTVDEVSSESQASNQPAPVPEQAAPEAQATARPGLPSLVSVGPSGFEPTPIGGKLYREMSPQNLADALRMHNQGDVSSAFFTDNIDLALGQGDNRGVMVQYRGEAVSGSQHQKPGITERTGREYRADYVGADAIDQVLLPSGARLSVLAKNMLARHFDRTEPEEGRILYTRKGVDVGTPLHQLMATGIQQSIPAAPAPRGVLAKKAEAEGEATEFPLKAAAASYSGISHSGSDRAKSDAQEFQTYIDVARDAGLAIARTDAQKAAVEQAAGELRAEYLTQYGRLMNVRSSTYSGFVAGRSRLNARQADQRNSAYNRAIDTFVDWQKANEDRVRRAALDARTPEQVQADQQAVETARREKAERKEAKDRALMRSILSWKKGGEPVEIALGALLAGVNKGRDGYPSSIKLQPADGATLVDDKFDLAQLFRERGMSVPQSKQRVRELVDAVRGEDAAAKPAPKTQESPSASSKRPTKKAKKPLADEASPPQPGEQSAVQYSFAGRNAQGADRLALETARQRIAMGEAAEAVRQDTGWHRGADGRWRFEISDDQARIAVAGANAASIIANAEMRALDDGRAGATVGDVLDHQQLFAAYPSLRDLPLRLMPADSPALARLQRRPVGFAVQMQGSIPRDEMASPLIHELQHAIQNIEGFALGGSRRMFASDLDATGAETYRRLAGEVEARNVQMRMRMTPGLRQAITPEATADVPSGEVLVTFNGADLMGAPQPQNITGHPPMTAQGLVRAFDLQFPKLTKAVRTMLQRGQEGKRGGLVFIDSPDPLRIAGVFSRKTGTSLNASVQLFEDKGRIQGFYDAKSGLTFLVGPNLDPVTGPAVLLHEMTHGQQREKIDRQASNMLMNRASVKNADLRAFLDRVAGRMVDAGETANPREAAAYIVEQAVIEGREQGFGEADSRFLGWVDQAIGKPVGDFLRTVLAMVRQWMLRHGLPIGQITVGDLVDYAMAGVERAAAGDVRGEGVSLSQDDLQKARILQGPPVSVLRGDEAPRGMAAVREWATQLFKEQGGLANNPDLGAVVLDGRAVRDSLGHGRPNPYKYAAFAAVKEVLERGALVHQASYKGGESFYVSAPVVIDGMDDIVTVLVRREPSMQRMYLHSVATKGYLLSRRGSGADADAAEQRTGSSGSEDVASVLQRLLTATLDSDPGDGPQFSRSGLREIAGKATLELNRTFTAPGKLSWWHKTIGTMYNLAERSPFFKPVFESAQGFIDDVSHYAADAAEHAPKLLPKLETWRDIAKSPVSAADNKAVAKPVFEGTLMWARDVDGQPVRVESLAERAAKLTADQKAEILLATGKIPPGMLNAWRALSPEQFGKMVDSRYEAQMLKAGIVWTDAELRSIFKLTDQQVELYREFRAATDRSLDTMARADMLRFVGDDAKELRDEVMDAPDVHAATRVLRDHLARRADEWPDRATHLLDLAHGVTERAERVTQLQTEGYAPLSRFGKYTVDVVGQDGERQYFSLFESKREANLMAEQMKGVFPGANISQGTLSEEAYKMFAGITPETLELFGNALGFDSQGDSAQDQAFQEYLRLTKTNRSAMRRLIHRKGIAGYSDDVGRVLASFVYSNARQTAAGLHLGDLAEAVDAIPQQQGELKDAAVRLAEYIRNPQEEAQAVRGLLFAQYLGGSVASAFVNMTQPVAVSFPWLSQYGGAGKAAAALGRAAKHMSTKGYQYEADLAKALKFAEDDGVVSPQEVHQLMAQARGSGSLRAGDGTRAGEARAMASNAVSRLSVAWGKLFGAAEQVNRRVTFIAAYRLAKDQGMRDPAAFARRAVTETQFVYSKASKMQWGRGAVGGTLMTFKTYSVAYLELMHRLWNQGEPGSQERKDGRKAAMLMIATLMLMSGVGGLPFGEDAEDLIDGAAQLMGYNFSAQKAMQQFLEEVFGQGLAGFIEKGITGLPGMPLDVSGRLGMGNLIPGTGLLQERTDHTRDVLEIAGPAGDMASRFVSGGRKILGGDIGSGLLEMSPTAVRNAAKGVDMAATGMYRDTKGYKVLETSHLEAAMKAIGFQPASVAQVQEANWLNQRAKAFYSLRAQEIRAQWAAGIFERDQAKVAAARQQIADWNARNPDQPMIIRVPDIMRRVREMSKSKDQRIADTAPRAMRAAMREELARSRE
ncbi:MULTISPECIES: PLxRFG domain-containing protein [unclassified Pseudomonas]|uniref:PLxRFG domain-containing protein n=1 Tax=unclassified Pseudomonas TaxID=196821 RepID=UPI00244D4018|nr:MULTISPECIES: PLxRFG domain-containing protein [unclassified Pseudomonas]MDG9927396.1 PLxRFG domain-containing protein [Pseudomonas sp. GD04042]MDH0482465.1 PLxRFG domain-containing protein [Pseudomonas sp. GD04015]MDH0602817.1 PLxRFG domain-containing protein [Pseudomonas sp. GD03869]